MTDHACYVKDCLEEPAFHVVAHNMDGLTGLDVYLCHAHGHHERRLTEPYRAVSVHSLKSMEFNPATQFASFPE